MAYKDAEKAKQASSDRVRRYRERQKGDVTPDNVTPFGVTPMETVTPCVTPEMSREELQEALQWGIDNGKIRTSPQVAEAIGLTPRYGPQRLDQWQLLALVNRYCYQQGIYPASTYLGAHDGPEYGVSIIPDGTPAYLPIPKGLRQELPKSRIIERNGFLHLP